MGVRKVRDAAFWGVPVGTVIAPGMKPRGSRGGASKSARDLMKSGGNVTDHKTGRTVSGPAAGKADNGRAAWAQLLAMPQKDLKSKGGRSREETPAERAALAARSNHGNVTDKRTGRTVSGPAAGAADNGRNAWKSLLGGEHGGQRQKSDLEHRLEEHYRGYTDEGLQHAAKTERVSAAGKTREALIAALAKTRADEEERINARNAEHNKAAAVGGRVTIHSGPNSSNVERTDVTGAWKGAKAQPKKPRKRTASSMMSR